MASSTSAAASSYEKLSQGPVEHLAPRMPPLQGAYNIFAPPGDEQFASLTTGPTAPAKRGSVSRETMSYIPSTRVDSPTLSDDTDFLDLQRSSQTLFELPWALPSPQLMISTTNTPYTMPSESQTRFSITSDESFKLVSSSSLEIDNTAREHPLYHNVTPKADGLYHCPFEDDPKVNCTHKPEKLKCNYDKFVDFHLKPYKCKVNTCKELCFSHTACLLRHEREAHAMHGHGDKPFLCTYERCERGVPGNGFPRHWNLRDHMKRVHNDPGHQPKSNASGSPPPSGPPARTRKRKASNLTADIPFIEEPEPQKRNTIPPIVIRQPQEPSQVEYYHEKHQIHQDTRNFDNMELLGHANLTKKFMIQTAQRIHSTVPLFSALPDSTQAIQEQRHDDQEQVQHSTLTAGVLATEINAQEIRSLTTLNIAETKEVPKHGYQSTNYLPSLLQSKSTANSTSSEDETDWEEDSDVDLTPLFNVLNPRYINNGEEGEKQLFASVQTTSTKAQLVERLMEDFWLIFNQRWKVDLRQRVTTSESTSPTAHPMPLREGSTKGNKTKRLRRDGDRDDEDGDEDNGRSSKRHENSSQYPDITQTTPDFACPFRKHNPRKYCVQDWPRCALTAQPTIARVKGHLYRYHLIHQCQRCKRTFVSEEELDTHIEAIEGCDSKMRESVEGITRKMKEQIQCRKKAHPGQTQEERWKQIYHILFPNEVVPDPYFEPVRDHESEMPQSPDSINLTEYETYLRRLLPQFVRRDLEIMVNSEIQPIEEQLRNRILQVIEEAQDRVFASYRVGLSSNTDSPSVEELDANPGVEAEDNQQTGLDTSFQPRTCSIHDSGLHSRNIEYNISSDSGYVSNVSWPGSSSDAQLDRTGVDIRGSPNIWHQKTTNSDDLNVPPELRQVQPMTMNSENTVNLEDFYNINDREFGHLPPMQDGDSRDNALLFDENWPSSSAINSLGMGIWGSDILRNISKQ